ncbi:MAG: alpha/beta hydrolase-fold protein, partial [Bacteroidota bacterium]
GWVQFGEVNRYADQAIAEGRIAPMIIVMPDAKVTWYVNDAKGKQRYEDFFIQEFMPHIEQSNRIRRQKEFRGITGLSMGGYGALLYAMKYPDLFAAAAPLSAAIYTEAEVMEHEQERWDRVEGDLYGSGLAGAERITAHWKANNPLHLAKTLGKEALSQVSYYFDCGDDDFLFRGNAAIHVLFREMEIPHEFRIRDGAHDWTYWRTGITDALAFLSTHFHR